MFRFGVKNRGFGFRVALALGIAFATILAATPAQAYIAVARTTYIVQVKLGTADAVRAVIGKLGETPHDELTEVMDGFVLDLTDTEASALRADANVIQVVADQSMSMFDTQNPTPSWGLDRIDQDSTTYDNTYNYSSTAGAGVRVYVVDTGVMASDPDFAGRIETGADMLGQNLQGADCNGHGTHVAGTVAGTKYGVAKKATIVPVRVLGCTGSGSWSGFISAIDWIIANHPAGTPGVMSASLGGLKYQLVNDAVQKLYAAGITPIIAAGNSNADACSYSPASTPNAITVGASDSADTRASFSNFGDCVDVFAPGVNIVSNNYLDSTTGRSLSGTSMATPHVSGLAALYLADHQTATPSEVAAAIQAGAQAGKIVDAKSANGNYLMNIKFTNAALPPVGAPTGVVASAITATGATISWTAPAGTQAANSYKVEYRESSATTWTSVDAATTTTTLTGLTANSTYNVRVVSIAGTTISPASPELIFSTLADVPDAPTNLRVTATYGSQISLAWDAPANANGSKLTGYEVWMDVAGVWTKKMSTSATIANVTGLTASTTYSLRVIAINAAGSSQPTAALSATTTSATPTVVVMTTRTGLTATGVTLNYNAVAQIDSATPITYKAVVTNTANNAVVGTFTSSTTSVTLTGLTRYTIYSVVVTAYSGTIAGPPSYPYTFRTLADVPSEPTGVSAKKSTNGQMNITWTAPRDNGGVAITNYKIEQFVAGAWVLVATNDVTVNNLLVPEPAPAATEQYRVSAVNSIGTGPAAPVAVVGTVVAPQPPTGVTLTQSTTSSTQGVLTWVAPSNNGGAAVSSYTIVRSADNATTWSNVATGVTALTYIVSLPPKGATYQFAVIANNSAGASARSTSVSYSNAATVPAAPSVPALSWNTDGTLKVLWVAPNDNGGSAITGYKVQRLVGASFETVQITSGTTVNLAREAIGASYTIRVIATNAVGDSLPSGAAVKVVPAAISSAPLNLTVTPSSTGRLQLTWEAPASAGGTAIIGYAVQYSANAGATWVALTSTATLTVGINMPPKGSSYQYRVYAINSAGNSEPSNVVTYARGTSVPDAPSVRPLVFGSDTNLVASWYAPADNGGSPITGYRVEYSTNGQTFSTLSTVAANVFSVTIPREAPGVRAYVRVFAITALGESPASSTVNVLTPLIKATAPQNFTAVESGTVVATAWAAPTSLGGATAATYFVQISRDAGATWQTVNSTAGLTLNVARPAKGSTWQYRVVASTSFGLGDYSNVASVAIAATAPSAPSFRSLVINNSTSMIDISWFAPSDNGGSPITSYTLQKSLDQQNWSTVLTTNSATVLSTSVTREAPGVRLYFRISATTALGASANSATASIQMPFAKPATPANFAAVDKGTYVATSWDAVTDRGGSSYLYYYVQSSTNGGTTWSTVASSSSGLTYNVVRPTKGTSRLYRVVVLTQYGYGDPSPSVTISAPLTVASSPSIRSYVLNSDQTSTLTFNGSGDNGGTAITSYVVEYSTNGTTWSQLATAEAAGSAIQVPKQAPGVRLYVRVIAVNSVGNSVASSVAAVQTPYVQASEVRSLTAVTNASYVSLAWQAPSDLGGAPSVSTYFIESSVDSVNWTRLASTSGVALNITKPAKGVTLNYRVIAQTAWGLSPASNTVSSTTAATITTSVTSVIVSRLSTGEFNISFRQPYDLGGVSTWGYKLQMLQNNNYVTVQTGTGAAVNNLVVASPATNVYVYYRIIATNSVGDSSTYTILVRG